MRAGAQAPHGGTQSRAEHRLREQQRWTHSRKVCRRMSSFLCAGKESVCSGTRHYLMFYREDRRHLSAQRSVQVRQRLHAQLLERVEDVQRSDGSRSWCAQPPTSLSLTVRIRFSTIRSSHEHRLFLSSGDKSDDTMNAPGTHACTWNTSRSRLNMTNAVVSLLRERASHRLPLFSFSNLKTNNSLISACSQWRRNRSSEQRKHNIYKLLTAYHHLPLCLVTSHQL